MPASRPPLSSRLITGPLAFLLAGLVDVSAAWGRWGLHELARRSARRTAR
jgi:hypothetical protein